MLYVNYISIKLRRKEIIISVKKMKAYFTKQKVGSQYVLVAKLYIFAVA